ncbi:serine hydrolase domain-containing protein [Humibacillus xanthopallidus]|uniref:serine hydrolase domain-containing protein n=1 Tax=Humibacillus xanthopallidus TaxID=412689 RepID=UPI00384C6D4E
MDQLPDEVARVAQEHGFDGVVRVDRRDRPQFARAFGLAERGFGVPNTLETQFGLASATKGLTALTVMSLINEGRLMLDTTARSLLGDDLPEIDDEATVEHLLAHRSGIGDYVDEDGGFEATDYVMTVPLHELATTEGYLTALSGRPAKSAPGETFAYNNSGYVILAILTERVTGSSFHELVGQRVCRPASMRDTAFLRSDELPARAARGYLAADGLRTNVLHLPVCGTGDGGVYATVADVHRLWHALFHGRIVAPPWVEEMVRPRSDVPAEHRRYGLGFWLHQGGDAVLLEGYDAGVSFRSLHDRAAGLTFTVVSNTTEGAWPVAGFLEDHLLG